MKIMNIDFAGEFLVMASTLTHIKSKMLLPVHEIEDDEEDDPRLEITRPLVEYLQIKSAAEDLAGRHLLGVDTFVRPAAKADQFLRPEDNYVQIGLFELIDAFQSILKSLAPEDQIDFSADRISVNDRIAQLVDKFENKRTLTFDELFDGTATREMLVVTFLAILEMVKLSLLRMAQHSQTGVIRLFYQ
jgi:segregation and condensation protein A